VQEASTVESVVTLERFQISQVRHELLSMPVLLKSFQETVQLAVSGTVSIFFGHGLSFAPDIKSLAPFQSLLFEFNAQHDCYHGKCAATGQRSVMQERVRSGKTEKYIEHAATDRWIINTHALHNAHLLRLVVPRELIRPIPFVVDRHSHHCAMALGLRTNQVQKNKATDDAAEPSKKRKADTLRSNDSNRGTRDGNQTLGPGQLNFQVNLAPPQDHGSS
jgi:hypothetical protein